MISHYQKRQASQRACRLRNLIVSGNTPAAEWIRYNKMHKKEPAFRLVLSLSVGITYLPGQAKDCPAGITVRWTVIGRKNLLLLQEASYVGIPYPPG